MIFYCPRDYKNGKYYFNKYDAIDLIIMVPSIVVGTVISILSLTSMSNGNFILSMSGLSCGILINGVTLILFMPYRIYHNILNRVIVEIKYQIKQKDFLWYGYDFNNYEEI